MTHASESRLRPASGRLPRRLGYTALSYEENFQAFRIGRENLVRVLQGLRFEEWDRAATFLGKANTFTVFGETMRMARHESEHWDQLTAHHNVAG